MTLQQVKTLLIGVLKGWFTNKGVLDKFSEEDGVVLYDGEAIGGGENDFENAETLAKISESEDGKLMFGSKAVECVCATYEDSEIQTAITETLAALEAPEEPGE